MPENTISVTMPGTWGNPFKIGDRYAHDDSFYRHYGQFLTEGLVTCENWQAAFEAYCQTRLRITPDWLDPLRGKSLACWCAEDVPCHADILLRLANT